MITQRKKILKNTTNSDIELGTVGITLFANTSTVIDASDYPLFMTEDFINEIEPLLVSGDVVTNDNQNDISDTDEAIHYWSGKLAHGVRFSDDAEIGNGFSALNVQDAIEEAAKNSIFLQYQLLGQLNYTEYIYSYKDDGGPRSGDRSNGYQFSGSSPIIAPFTGTIQKTTSAIKGVAVSTGSPAGSVDVNLELWKVGFNSEGTKLGDITLNIDSSIYTIGAWWNTSIDTDFSGVDSTLNISVAEGDLLAVKFIRQQNNSNAVAIRNATISLQLKED